MDRSGGDRWLITDVKDWWRRHRDCADGRWDTKAVAEELGLTWDTVRKYRLLGRLPEPDGVDANHPWWWPETIQRWDAQREKRDYNRSRMRRGDGYV